METYIEAQKIEIIYNKHAYEILDSQCRLANKFRNMLVEMVRETIKNGDKRHYADTYSLRNEVPGLKKKHPYLYSMFSSPLKNLALQVRDGLRLYLKDSKAGMPKYHSYKKDGCSLYYEDPNVGVKIKNKNLRLSLGSVLTKEGKEKRLYLNLILAERIKKCIKIKTYRIVRNFNKYYLVVIMEVEKQNSPLKNRCIALDFNHKNFFVGVDSEGKSYEMSNLPMLRYFNDEIDHVQKKQTPCKHMRIKREDGYVYHQNSSKYDHYTKIVKKLFDKRNVQVKQALFTIANWLVDNYDVIAVGDYTPNIFAAPRKRMRKKVMCESEIGRLRRIIQCLCEKKVKTYILIDEKNTTKKCCICGNEEHKGPEVRGFTCKSCNKMINRDINSAINIGVKGNILSSSDYVDLDLSKPTYAVNYNWKTQTLCFKHSNLITEIK